MNNATFCHNECDDLESLLHVILTVCTYMEKPGKLRRPLKKEASIPMSNWFTYNKTRRNALARNKIYCLDNFRECIGRRLSPYWQDFIPYLERLVKACWPQTVPINQQSNTASHGDFLKILEEALEDFADEEVYPYAAVTALPTTGNKRQYDEEGVAGQFKKQARGGSRPLHFPHGQVNQTPYQDSVECASNQARSGAAGAVQNTQRGTT